METVRQSWRQWALGWFRYVSQVVMETIGAGLVKIC